MGLCDNCTIYSKRADEFNRDFNDVGAVSNHYCIMYRDAIPDGIYDGNNDCEYFEEKGGKTWNADIQLSSAGNARIAGNP